PVGVGIGTSLADATRIVTPGDVTAGTLAEIFDQSLLERRLADSRPLVTPVASGFSPAPEALGEARHLRHDALCAATADGGAGGDVLDDERGESLRVATGVHVGGRAPHRVSEQREAGERQLVHHAFQVCQVGISVVAVVGIPITLTSSALIERDQVIVTGELRSERAP